MPENKLLYLVFCVTLGLLTISPQIAAQETSPSPAASPSPESEELKRLIERNRILAEEKKAAEAESDIAKSKKSEFEAKYPKPTASPLEGNTTVDDGVKLESHMMAFKAMSEAADKIAAELENQDLTSLAIYNEKDIKALLAYMLVSNQIEVMRTEYGKLLKPLPTATPAATSFTNRHALLAPNVVSSGISVASSVLGSFIDLVALLRTDTTVKGLEFDIEETALVSEVFRALKVKRPQSRFYYPATFPPNIDPNKTTFRILARLEEIYILKSRADALLIAIGETEKSTDETKTGIAALKAKLKQTSEDIPSLDKELERLQKVYWRWPSGRLAERIEEVTGKLAKLTSEKSKIPLQIEENTAELVGLQQKLDELYEEVLPLLEADEAVLAALDQAGKKITEVTKVLGRPFTEQEVTTLLGEGFTETEAKTLVKIAEQHLGHKLTVAERNKLLTPLSDAERVALKAIYERERITGSPLTDSQKLSLLSEADQAHLLSDADQSSLRKLKQASLTKLRALNAQYDKLITELTTVDSSAGINALSAYLQSENLYDGLKCPKGEVDEGMFDENKKPDSSKCSDGFIMQLKVIKAGGNNRIKKNLVTTFFTGAQLSHSGGAIVEYVLYDLKGAARFSNTFTVYESYKPSAKIKDLSTENK